MGTKMAVAFSVIFMADIDKMTANHSLLIISFHCGTFQPKKFTILLTSLTHSTLQISSLLVK